MVQLRVTDAALQEDGSCRRGGEMFLGATGAFRKASERRAASLHVPIRPVPNEVLMTDLEASGIVCEVSAVYRCEARRARPRPALRLRGDVEAPRRRGPLR